MTRMEVALVEAARVEVIIGPTGRVDLDTVRDVVATTLAELAVAGEVVAATDAAELGAAVDRALADPRVAPVVVPGPDAATRQLIEARPGAARMVWCDVESRAPGVASRPAGTYIYGRGLDSLAWAIRRVVHLRRWPVRQYPYGSDAEQVGELRLPAPAQALTSVRPPVAVLLHGGFWRSIWAFDLMDALAIDLAGRGYAAWNLEYRRPDRNGWKATVDDVAAGLAVLRELSSEVPLDLDRVVLIGHSAGGQLALQAAADTVAAGSAAAGSAAAGSAVRIVLAVSLAGVLDLAEADRRALSAGATAGALGGSVDEIPQVYAAASPLARVPLGVPQLIVVGDGDDLDFVDMSRRYAEAAASAGDEVTLAGGPGDHFDVIDPRSTIWQATADRLTRP
jgi:acetyl esterase/lipase